MALRSSISLTVTRSFACERCFRPSEFDQDLRAGGALPAGPAGKLKLTDMYTVSASDLVQDSDIMGGLTPGVTKITLRDLATMMSPVSDNSATNVVIDRVGMENVNALLNSLALRTPACAADDGPESGDRGRKNVSTPPR